jgi:hypothetical protein
MEIKIIQPPIGIATLNLNKFKESMKQTMNLEESTKNNLVVEQSSEEVDNATIIKMIYLTTDWKIFFHLLPKIKKDVTFQVMKIEIDSFNAYEPDVIKPEQGLFKLKELKMTKPYYVSLFTCNKRYDKQIEHLLGMNLIEFGNKEWKVEVNLDEIGR